MAVLSGAHDRRIEPLLLELLALERVRVLGIVALAPDGPPLRRRTSLHRSLAGRTATGETVPLWLKRYLVRPGDARRQERYLLEVEPRFADTPALGVPSALGSLSCGVLLTTREARETLTARRRRGAATGEDWRRAGEWLALLHQDRRDGDPFPARRVSRAILDLLESLVRRGIVTEPWRAGVSSRLEDLEGTLSRADLVRVRTHGDFAPYNLLVDDARVVGLDFSFHGYLDSERSACPPAEDLAKFLLGLDEPAASMFWDAYAGSASGELPERRAPVLRWFGALHALRSLLEWRSRWRRLADALDRGRRLGRELATWRVEWLDRA